MQQIPLVLVSEMKSYKLFAARPEWFDPFNYFTLLFEYFYPSNTLVFTLSGIAVMVKTYNASTVMTYNLVRLNTPLYLCDLIASDFFDETN